ncbi:MAG: SdpI family protein [Anaerococcus sp.]|nr:SdpI family protein [Anaerococcus sp.]
MSVGFHLWEVCYSKETWEYGNRLASKIAIILGILFFAIIYPLLLYIRFKRSYLIVVLICIFILYFISLFILVKIIMRKKFNLK